MCELENRAVEFVGLVVVGFIRCRLLVLCVRERLHQRLSNMHDIIDVVDVVVVSVVVRILISKRNHCQFQNYFNVTDGERKAPRRKNNTIQSACEWRSKCCSIIAGMTLNPTILAEKLSSKVH